MKFQDEDWLWPAQGEPIDALVERVLGIRSPYRNFIPPICYPGTLLDPDLLAHAGGILVGQINCIGASTIAGKGEGGFEFAQTHETCVIGMIASMLGGGKDSTDGFFCEGGTESVLQGMWLGREYLDHCPDPQDRGTVILTSVLNHYCINKAARVLAMGFLTVHVCPYCQREHVWRSHPSGRGMNLAGINARGEMDVDDLERVFRARYAEGFRRFLVVATAGTTVMGSIDPIADIGAFIERAERETNARFYLHVDASFGAFTIPFLEGSPEIGFGVPKVMSMTADADKMGHLPYPAGVFLCRKGLLDYISTYVRYVGGHRDDTLMGSRTFLPAALGWIKFRSLGMAGQRAYVERCLTQRDRLAELLVNRFGETGPVRVLPFSKFVNLLPVEIDFGNGDIPEYMRSREGRLGHYELRSDFVPKDPADPGSCPRVVYKICVMPHMFGTIDRFVSDLEEAYHQREC